MAEQKYSSNWEFINNNNSIRMYRVRVPGGWIVHVRDDETNDSNNMVIQDPTHEWVPTTQIDPD